MRNFALKEELCINNEEFCIYHDELCSFVEPLVLDFGLTGVHALPGDGAGEDPDALPGDGAGDDPDDLFPQSASPVAREKYCGALDDSQGYDGYGKRGTC